MALCDEVTMTPERKETDPPSQNSLSDGRPTRGGGEQTFIPHVIAPMPPIQACKIYPGRKSPGHGIARKWPVPSPCLPPSCPIHLVVSEQEWGKLLQLHIIRAAQSGTCINHSGGWRVDLLCSAVFLGGWGGLGGVVIRGEGPELQQ